MIKAKMNDLIKDIDELLSGNQKQGELTACFKDNLHDLKLEILSDFRSGCEINLIECHRLINSLCSLYGVYRC